MLVTEFLWCRNKLRQERQYTKTDKEAAAGCVKIFTKRMKDAKEQITKRLKTALIESF